MRKTKLTKARTVQPNQIIIMLLIIALIIPSVFSIIRLENLENNTHSNKVGNDNNNETSFSVNSYGLSNPINSIDNSNILVDKDNTIIFNDNDNILM